MRIDAAWGSPDSLQYYPCDSFEVDTAEPVKMQKHLRCKHTLIRTGPNGDWQGADVGKPFDWHQSLTDLELVEIAKNTRALVEHHGQAMSVMWFAGVDSVGTGHPALLPWHRSFDVPVGSANARSVLRRTLVVKSLEDLAALRQAGDLRDFQILRLQPKVELLRNEDFLAQTADLAGQNDLTIALTGSELSHSYYFLRRRLADKVQVVDPFEPNEPKIHFGKLVRDMIPVHIQSQGEMPRTVRLTPEELTEKLRYKLIEEAHEYSVAINPEQMLGELADVQEVVRACCLAAGFTQEELDAAVAKKRAQRGGFSEGVFLESTEREPLITDLAQRPRRSEPAIGRSSLKLVSKLPLAVVENIQEAKISLIPPDISKQPQEGFELQMHGYVLTIRYSDRNVFVSARQLHEPISADGGQGYFAFE